MAYFPPPNWNQPSNIRPHINLYSSFGPTHFLLDPFSPRASLCQPVTHPMSTGRLTGNNNSREIDLMSGRRERHGGMNDNHNTANTQLHSKKNRHDRALELNNEERARVCHCEPCGRDFKTEEHLNAHLSSHTQCKHEGCSFIASRKILKLHEIQFHAPGRFRIKLDTPEEIFKWREQRKRNYPTASNVAKKVQKQQEQQKTGKVLKDKNFRYKGRRNGRGNSNFKWEISTQEQICNDKNDQNDILVSIESKEGIPSSVNDEDPLDIVLRQTGLGVATEVSVKDLPKNLDDNSTIKTTPASCTALSSLRAMYNSDSSDDEGEIQHMVKEMYVTSTKCLTHASSTDENRSVNQSIKLTNDIKPLEEKQDLEAKSHKGKRVKTIAKKRQQSTLLEMLLAADIRHERNIILQCLRYLTENQFLGISTD